MHAKHRTRCSYLLPSGEVTPRLVLLLPSLSCSMRSQLCTEVICGYCLLSLSITMLFPYQTLNSLSLNLSLQTLFCVFMSFVIECKCVPTQQRQCGRGNLNQDSPYSESGEWQIRSQPGLHRSCCLNQSINRSIKH